MAVLRFMSPAIGCLCLCAGCAASTDAVDMEPRPTLSAQATPAHASDQPGETGTPETAVSASNNPFGMEPAATSAQAGAEKQRASPPRGSPPESTAPRRGFAGLLMEPPRLDERALREAGIRLVQGRHLDLYTDVPHDPEIDRLPQVFDMAFPQWCDAFGIDAARRSPWRITGCLMTDRPRFEAVGLIDPSIRDFANGYAVGMRLWMYNQSSPYYRRHLLLHEGCHALLNTLASARQPPSSWYVEGLAELFATHRLDGDRLHLGWYPTSAEEVHRWGRIDAVRKAFEGQRAWTMPTLVNTSVIHHESVEQYGWCWALAAFLHGHPRYRDRYQALLRSANVEGFPEQFRQTFIDGWEQFEEDWQVFVAEIEYGYDFDRCCVEYRAGKPVSKTREEFSIRADRGWQATPWQLEPGASYRLTARGRFQVREGPPAWDSEPGGITIQYYRGFPLGQLRGAIRGDFVAGETASGLTRPMPLGLDTVIQPSTRGTLYLKINDSPALLADNAGEIHLVLEQLGTMFTP